MFKVSDKVVCVVNSTFHPLWKGVTIDSGPTVYVVRDVRVDSYTGLQTLLFVGVINSIHPDTGEELSYRAFRFRKLDDIKAENTAKAYLEANDADLIRMGEQMLATIQH